MRANIVRLHCRIDPSSTDASFVITFYIRPGQAREEERHSESNSYIKISHTA
jgi:hypothetical protein